jgi:hypothetical protein
MLRDGSQYSFDHVQTYAGYVRAVMTAGQTLFVAGYSNGGGISACVGSSIGAYAWADWAGPASIASRGCDRNIGRAALFSTTGDTYRSAELASARHETRTPLLSRLYASVIPRLSVTVPRGEHRRQAGVHQHAGLARHGHALERARPVLAISPQRGPGPKPRPKPASQLRDLLVHGRHQVRRYPWGRRERRDAAVAVRA